MIGYVERVLVRFNVNMLARPQHSPHAIIQPNYSAAIQFTDMIDQSETISADNIGTVQEIIDNLL